MNFLILIVVGLVFFCIWYQFNRLEELKSKSKLKRLLERKNFRGADIETRRILLFLSNRHREGFLRDIDIENLSCQDLGDIDKIWIRSSNGRFGYSVQREIWKKHGLERHESKWIETPDDPRFTGYRIEKGFPVEVGWWHPTYRQSGTAPIGFKRFHELSFTLEAPVGHLPTHLRTVDRRGNGEKINHRTLSSIDAVYLGEEREGCTLALARKIDECQL